MDKIKKFIDCYIPTELCNLRCHYCYITQKRKFNNKLATFDRSPQEIRKALSKKRLGGVCLLNFCAGGETLLSENVLPVVKALLEEGHYVMIVTNGTISERFIEISKWDKKLLNHLFFKFSFHFLELKRLNMMDKFFNNVKLMKSSGSSFTVELTPSDELIPYIDEVKQVCVDNLGALCHVTIARDDRTNGIEVLSGLSFEEYKKTWSVFDSELFNFKSEIFYKHRTEFCYAGLWSAWLKLDTGDIYPCNCGKCFDNIYKNIKRPIRFRVIGKQCSLAHCYNGHAWLALGNIPELITPTYAEERNRKCSDGTEWLTADMKSFMSSKLCENNKQYSERKKRRFDKSSQSITKKIKNRISIFLNK